MLARAAWLAASALLLTATPTLSVEGLQHALDGALGAPGLDVQRDVAVPAPVPLPVPLPVEPGLGVQARLAPHARVEVSIGVLGGGKPAAGGDRSAPGPTRMVAGDRPALNAPSQVAAVVAEHLRRARAGGPAFSLMRVDDALGGWRALERPDRLLVGQGQLAVRDADGLETACGLTAAALYAVEGDHLRLAVRAVDPNPACVPLSSSAPHGTLRADGDGWRVEMRNGKGQGQMVRVGQGERAVPLDYEVALRDGTTFTFHGLLDALPVEPAGSA